MIGGKILLNSSAERTIFFPRLLGLFCCLSLIYFISGCARLGAYNPATGRREFIAISTQTEIALGEDLHLKIIDKEQLSKNPVKQNRLERVGQRLAAVSDRQDYDYHFYVINQEEMNAYTIPGGHIYVYSGLMNQLEKDEELAAVVAHEIGHCAAKHTAKRFQAALGYSLISAIVFSQVDVDDRTRATVSIASNTAVQLATLAYSRQDEYEADRLAVKYMYLAGYDLDGMIKTLEFLKQESRGPRVPLILRTHPYIEDRLKAVYQEVNLAPEKYSL